MVIYLLVGGGGVGFKFPLASGCVFVVVAVVVIVAKECPALSADKHSFIYFVHLVLPLQFYT